MEVWEWTLTIALPLAALLWGAALSHQSGTWFLAGWNTLPPEEKASWQAKALCRLYGTCVMGCGLGLFLLLNGSFQGEDLPLLLGLGIFGAMVVLSLVLPRLCPKRYRIRE